MTERPPLRRRLRRATRPARHALAYAALSALIGGLRLLSSRAALGLGGQLARWLGPLSRTEHRRMAAQLKAALGDQAPSPGDCWADLGRRFVAFARGERGRVHIGEDTLRRLREALAEGRGVLLCTAYLGNWELLAAALSAHGIEAHSLAARPGSGPLFHWLRRHRERLGVHAHGPGRGALIFRQRCREGKATGLFIDQQTRELSRPVPFFGRPAPTPLTAERLCRLTGARPLLILAEPRPEDAQRYEVSLHALPTEGLLEAATQHIERAIRRAPAAWVWQHARW